MSETPGHVCKYEGVMQEFLKFIGGVSARLESMEKLLKEAKDNDAAAVSALWAEMNKMKESQSRLAWKVGVLAGALGALLGHLAK